LDLKAANRAQLITQGVQYQNIEVSPYSTVAHVADYFSHRAEKGVTGRMLAVIAMKTIS
jgi:copper oxidase (laccase) domain-containing protein